MFLVVIVCAVAFLVDSFTSAYRIHESAKTQQLSERGVRARVQGNDGDDGDSVAKTIASAKDLCWATLGGKADDLDEACDHVIGVGDKVDCLRDAEKNQFALTGWFDLYGMCFKTDSNFSLNRKTVNTKFSPKAFVQQVVFLVYHTYQVFPITQKWLFSDCVSQVNATATYLPSSCADVCTGKVACNLYEWTCNTLALKGLQVSLWRPFDLPSADTQEAKRQRKTFGLADFRHEVQVDNEKKIILGYVSEAKTVLTDKQVQALGSCVPTCDPKRERVVWELHTKVNKGTKCLLTSKPEPFRFECNRTRYYAYMCN
eukprot:TRINITY_DN58917_c0_g1_i1.p1 TRINITY_DN58917_c0_g1~~TRINITY_DN58917_c0_g1_i1.p1  ORF type:complete len:323 (+),score=14.10 TRINITY_DN58917_c0_g1_i1:27-971(+)